MERKILKAFLAQAKKAKDDYHLVISCMKLEGSNIEFSDRSYYHVRLTVPNVAFESCFVETKLVSKAVTVGTAKTVNITTSEKDVVIDSISLPNLLAQVETTNHFLTQPLLGECDKLELGSNFLLAIEKCIPYTATEKTRYEFDNVLVDFSKSVAAATDGKTLAVVPFTGGKLERQIVLPLKNASLLVELLDSSKPIILHLEKNDNLARFEQGNYQITVRLSEAKFPPYEKVVPDLSNYEHKFGISKKDLEKVCNFLKVFEVKKGNENEVAESTTTEVSLAGNVVSFNLPAKHHTISIFCGNDAKVATIKVNQKFLSRLLAVCDNGLVIHTRAFDKPLVATEGNNFFVILPNFAREAE